MQSDPVQMYHDLFAISKEPQLYAAPWWLDATCGAAGWDAVISCDDDGKPFSALPFHTTRIRGLSAVVTPPFTQWVSLLSAAHEDQKLNLAVLNTLPKTSILDLSIKPGAEIQLQDISFPIALKYSFIIPLPAEKEDIRAAYNEGLRRNIRQAEKNYFLEQSNDISCFLSLCHQSYKQQKMKPPPWLDAVVPEVFRGLNTHQCGALTIARSRDKIIAGVLTAWDQSTSYYLAGGRTADEQGASAHALLLDHAIFAAQARGTAFDFEGSMHPGIANFFQSFGGIPTAYWHIRKFRGVGRLWSILGK